MLQVSPKHNYVSNLYSSSIVIQVSKEICIFHCVHPHTVKHYLSIEIGDLCRTTGLDYARKDVQIYFVCVCKGFVAEKTWFSINLCEKINQVKE